MASVTLGWISRFQGWSVALRSVAEPPDYVRREFHEYESAPSGLLSRTSCLHSVFRSILLFRSYNTDSTIIISSNIYI